MKDYRRNDCSGRCDQKAEQEIPDDDHTAVPSALCDLAGVEQRGDNHQENDRS